MAPQIKWSHDLDLLRVMWRHWLHDCLTRGVPFFMGGPL